MKIHYQTSLETIKPSAGAPQNLRSCHTAIIHGSVIEGQVPADDIRRLLAGRPTAEGLAVAAMPVDSPGMEQAGYAYEASPWCEKFR